MWHDLYRRGENPQSCIHYGPGEPGFYARRALARNSSLNYRNHRNTRTMMMRRLLRRGSEEGSAAAQTALILPWLLLLIIGSIEFGRALWTYHRILLAVEEGGRYAMVYNPSSYPSGPPTSCGTQTQASQ